MVPLHRFMDLDHNPPTTLRILKYYPAKILLERMLATILLAVLLPLLAAIAVWVKLDSPGPALFRQPRYGRWDRPFEVLKFRSMYLHACDRSGRVQAGADDLRITRAGSILRTTSLDELPQLLNVVRGDMALVGPRAHPCGMTVEGVLCEDLLPDYSLRHRVKPGITGLAQASGSRGPVRSREALRWRTDLDNRYIEEWSYGLDVAILARTVLVVFRTAFAGAASEEAPTPAEAKPGPAATRGRVLDTPSRSS